MNRTALTVATVATLMLAGCAGDDGGQARTVPDPTATSTNADPTEDKPTSPPAATADLNAMVLTLNDMPSGWTTAPEMLEDDGSSGTSFCGVEDAELDISDDAGQSADAAFKQSDFGPFVMHIVGEVQDPSDATAAMDAMLNAASQCEEWTETEDDGTETTYRISPLSFHNVGDDTIAFRMSADADGMPLTIDMVVWQRDRLLAVVMLLALGATDADLLTELVDTAAGRM